VFFEGIYMISPLYVLDRIAYCKLKTFKDMETFVLVGLTIAGVVAAIVLYRHPRKKSSD
jgi:hypothetical protein